MRVLELEKCVDRLLRMQIETNLSPDKKAWHPVNQAEYNKFTEKEKMMADFCHEMEIVEYLDCFGSHSIQLRSDKVLKNVGGYWKSVTPTLYFKNYKGDEYIKLRFKVCKKIDDTQCNWDEKFGSYDEVQKKLIDIYQTDENSSFFRDIIPYSDSIWARLWRGFIEWKPSEQK